MAMNPLQLMQLQKLFETFRISHPKLPLFFKAVAQDALMEGTIIEITVESPEGKEYCTHMKLKASDVEMFNILRQMREQS